MWEETIPLDIGIIAYTKTCKLWRFFINNSKLFYSQISYRGKYIFRMNNNLSIFAIRVIL